MEGAMEMILWPGEEASTVPAEVTVAHQNNIQIMTGNFSRGFDPDIIFGISLEQSLKMRNHGL